MSGKAERTKREHRENGNPDMDATRRAGFTLVEMLVTLVLAGIVGAAVVGLLRQQHDFYQQADEISYAEEGTRAMAELLPRELRMASPEDIVRATSDEVTVRTPIWEGVACAAPVGSDLDVYVYHDPTTSVSGSGTYYRRADQPSYAYQDGWTPTVSSTGSTPEATCTSAGAPSGGANDRYVRLDWSGAPGSWQVTPGTVIRVYGELTYSLEPTQFWQGQGLSLWREGQELVGPLSGNASFAYVMADGSQTGAPGTLTDIRQIVVDATALGDPGARHQVHRDLTYDLAIRNSNVGSYGNSGSGGSGSTGGDGGSDGDSGDGDSDQDGSDGGDSDDGDSDDGGQDVCGPGPPCTGPPNSRPPCCSN